MPCYSPHDIYEIFRDHIPLAHVVHLTERRWLGEAVFIHDEDDLDGQNTYTWDPETPSSTDHYRIDVGTASVIIVVDIARLQPLGVSPNPRDGAGSTWRWYGDMQAWLHDIKDLIALGGVYTQIDLWHDDVFVEHKPWDDADDD